MKLASFFLTKTNGNWTKPMSEIEVHFPEIFLKFYLRQKLFANKDFYMEMILCKTTNASWTKSF